MYRPGRMLEGMTVQEGNFIGTRDTESIDRKWLEFGFDKWLLREWKVMERPDSSRGKNREESGIRLWFSLRKKLLLVLSFLILESFTELFRRFIPRTTYVIVYILYVSLDIVK